ncbi:MAG: acyl-CoA dehydrogenase, partial [Sphingopyxis sp.]|nr:acyl-CoA dehydrogenase [Sphingopyxis sp.]
GMGFVEETGAAQHYRDARIAPIYEGTNGIQAADLVGRKLGIGNGEPLDALIADIAQGAASEPALARLASDCGEVTEWMRSADVDDRLAGSSDFLAMLAVATTGWLMAEQLRVAQAMRERGEGDPAFLDGKIAVARFFLDRIVPEASGRRAGAMAGAGGLYAIDAATFAA